MRLRGDLITGKNAIRLNVTRYGIVAKIHRVRCIHMYTQLPRRTHTTIMEKHRVRGTRDTNICANPTLHLNIISTDTWAVRHITCYFLGGSSEIRRPVKPARFTSHTLLLSVRYANIGAKCYIILFNFVSFFFLAWLTARVQCVHFTSCSALQDWYTQSLSDITTSVRQTIFVRSCSC